MAIERTFSIIKPDAVERNKIGEITAMLESAGLRIVASKRIQLDQNKAASFYGCLLYTSTLPTTVFV